jgi:UDP-glucose 4-epimerase
VADGVAVGQSNDCSAREIPMPRPVSLVTGACGFIGSRMVEVLREAGHVVRGTDLQECCEKDDLTKGRYPSILQANRVKFIADDLLNPQHLDELLDGVNYVFHIAAVFSYRAPKSTLYAVNVEGTRLLLERLVNHPTLKRLVLWGAGGIYGFPPDDELPIREDDTPPCPPNNYLRSKLKQEMLAAQYHRRHGVPYCSVRPTTVYGPRGVYGAGQMIIQAAKMKPAAAPANWTGRIPFVHVDDVTRAALFLAGRKGSNGEAYNLVDDSQMTTVDYLRYTIAAKVGWPSRNCLAGSDLHKMLLANGGV